MKILVVGNPEDFAECEETLGQHDYAQVPSHEGIVGSLGDVDTVFDFLTSDRPRSAAIYAGCNLPVFLNTWRITLDTTLQAIRNNLGFLPIGFNGLPTMFKRSVLEVTLLSPDHQAGLTSVCEKLGKQFLIVDDRVGMVTPRVICMIINEAYYTVQEGTATRADIDLAMKLGTNYPLGPFEWCDRLGLKNVYSLLQAVYDDTRDERYKISALMKKEFLALRG